jgi:pSer/pThr/pTyr-binding forkhead associated (FHA) protein
MALVTLRILDGTDRGRTFEDLPTPITIGREDGNTIQLNDDRVSRFHVKIQEDREKVVLVDLESTNGTQVNGESVQMRILRYGDMLTIGRSVILYGSRDQIAARLAALRKTGADSDEYLTSDEIRQSLDEAVSLDFELNWSKDENLPSTLHILEPPVPPEGLDPIQSAQLSEMIEYLHIRMRVLLASVKVSENESRVTLDQRQWQSLVDLQARLAKYLRMISEPP